MRQQILMPPVTPTMTDGKVARWHVSEGQAVAAGDVLVEIATAAATLEIEASSGGRVERILVPAGTEGVKVNTPIAILFGGETGVLADVAGTVGLANLDAPAAHAPPPRPDLAVGSEARDLTYREALRDALAEDMRADSSVVLIGTDVAQNRGALKVAQGLLNSFGSERVVSIPQTEEAMFGLAVGAALAGLRPVVEVTHWARALETLTPYITTAAETYYLSGGAQAVPLVIRGPNGYVPGMTGQDARCVAADLSRIPGLKVAQPATASAAKVLLRAAIRDDAPVAVLEHELLYATRDPLGIDAPFDPAPGRARTLRTGRDVTIVAAGRAVVTALEAANKLALDGIEADVIDLMWIRPIDRETIAASVGRTGRLVTVEEGVGPGGLGADIVAHVAEHHLDSLKAPPRQVAGAPVPMPYADDLQALAIPQSADLVRAVEGIMRKTPDSG